MLAPSSAGEAILSFHLPFEEVLSEIQRRDLAYRDPSYVISVNVLTIAIKLEISRETSSVVY